MIKHRSASKHFVKKKGLFDVFDINKLIVSNLLSKFGIAKLFIKGTRGMFGGLRLKLRASLQDRPMIVVA